MMPIRGHCPSAACFIRPSRGDLYRYVQVLVLGATSRRRPGQPPTTRCWPGRNSLAARASNCTALYSCLGRGDRWQAGESNLRQNLRRIKGLGDTTHTNQRVAKCGCSSMAERQLPKLHTRVRFPSPAPDCHCWQYQQAQQPLGPVGTSGLWRAGQRIRWAPAAATGTTPSNCNPCPRTNMPPGKFHCSTGLINALRPAPGISPGGSSRPTARRPGMTPARSPRCLRPR